MFAQAGQLTCLLAKCSEARGGSLAAHHNQETKTMIETLITRRELCKALGIHTATARRWELAGRLRAFGLTSRLVRYSRADLERLLREAQAARGRKRGPKPKRPTANPNTPPANSKGIGESGALSVYPRPGLLRPFP